MISIWERYALLVKRLKFVMAARIRTTTNRYTFNQWPEGLQRGRSMSKFLPILYKIILRLSDKYEILVLLAIYKEHFL